MWGVSPVIASEEELPVASEDLSFYEASLTDSLQRIKKQDDKDQKKPGRKEKDSKKRPETDKVDDVKKEPKIGEVDPKRPNIKEVPRARPKLRPGTVTDRVKIKRPPVRVKPRRILRSVGI